MIAQKRKIKKISYRRVKKGIALAVLAISYLIWNGLDQKSPPMPLPGESVQIYANQCDDNLCPLLASAIKSAEQNITLNIYTLSEPKLIQGLLKKADEGIDVHLVVDKSSPNKLRRGEHLTREVRDLNGLMHRKILVIDREKVFIGSGNFTSDSLYLDDNLYAACCSKDLAKDVLQMRCSHTWIGGQRLDFYPLPEEKDLALIHLTKLLATAKKTIQVAMFTLTHPFLLDQLIDAKKRGVNVEVVVDRKTADGASQKAVERLVRAGLDVRLGGGSHTFHHKLAVIDGKSLAFGSANWTKAAFTHNEECLVIIEALTQVQIEKFAKLWHAIRCTSEVARCSLSANQLSIFEKSPVRYLRGIFPIRAQDSHNFSLASLFSY